MLSDHFLLVLSTYEHLIRPNPFRTFDRWLEEPSFFALFKKEWLQITTLSLEQNLKAMKKVGENMESKSFLSYWQIIIGWDTQVGYAVTNNRYTGDCVTPRPECSKHFTTVDVYLGTPIELSKFLNLNDPIRRQAQWKPWLEFRQI